MAKRRKKAAVETEAKAQQETAAYRVLQANAIFGEEFQVDEEDGERYVHMTPDQAKAHTDADVRLQLVDK